MGIVDTVVVVKAGEVVMDVRGVIVEERVVVVELLEPNEDEMVLIDVAVIEELAIAAELDEFNGAVVVLIFVVKELLGVVGVEADEAAEVPLGETMYSCRPFGPPQIMPESPAHFMLQRPSVAGTLPVLKVFPQ